MNLRDRPYLKVEVVEVKVKKKEEIPKGCVDCFRREHCGIYQTEYKKLEREGTWVNGENLDKVEFPCVCSYRKNQELKFGELDKVYSDGSFHLSLRELKQVKEGWYPGTYEAYYCVLDISTLFRVFDIHIEKAKIVIFKETK